jgi:hypothetical protein
MSDNNLDISERRLQEIGNQLGTPILSPTTKIQGDDESVPSPSQSNADIEGTIDSQPSSKNPILQYVVAGAIGLGAVGVPLTVLFGLGGTPQTATKPTAPEVEDTTSTLADRELDNLKTQSALDIQAKAESQPVAQTPKPAATPAPKPTPTVVASQSKPKPVVRAAAPQPKTITVPPPTVVAATPATVARPVPIPITRSVARVVPKPPAPVVQPPRPTPMAVATQPVTPTPTIQPVTPEQPPLSFEQASALGTFGGDNDKPDDGSLAVANGDTSTLTLTLPVGANVAAHTVTPYTSLSSRNIATNGTETPLSVQLDQPIQLSQGFNLPEGTIVQFGATVADNGSVTATSKGVFIDGTEIKVPVGAFALTASNSAALVANQRSLREGELSGADINAAMWGAAGGLGKALVDSGNTSVVNTSGLGTSVVQTNNGNVNIPGALLNSAFSPLAKAKEARANALAQELQQSSKLNEIPVRSPVRVFVASAATVRVPVGSEVNAAGTPEQERVLGGGEIEQPPTMIPAKPISAENVQPVIAPPPTTANTQPIVAPAPVTSTTQPTQGINTPSPIAPTKPNNVVNTRPPWWRASRSTIVVPQSVTTPTQPSSSTQFTSNQPIQTPTVTTPQPIVTAPAPITQPSVVPQSSTGVVVQPTTVPTTIERSATSQPAFIPPQPIQQPSITTSDRSTFIPPQPIPSTTTQTTPTPTQTIVIQQQPSTATQPTPLPAQPTGATTITTPIAPTKPNIINTQPQSSVPIRSNSGIDPQSPPIVSSTQLIEAQNTQDPAPITTKPTTSETSSRFMPVQIDSSGNIQPATIP